MKRPDNGASPTATGTGTGTGWRHPLPEYGQGRALTLDIYTIRL
ncbi:hypothetical protein [Acetobacter tropicalis]|nr:hypothetical protein [Acetobacter tropicalis]